MATFTFTQTIEHEFTFTQTIEHEIEEGYGVWFMPVWSGEDEPEDIADVDGGIIPITPETVREYGGAVCAVEPMPNGGTFGMPVENFLKEVSPHEQYDDTHDLRDRYFATREEAEEHLRYTLERFKYPEPWESFVRTI